MDTCPQSVAFCESTLSKTITPEILAMPQRRSCNKSLGTFSECLAFIVITTVFFTFFALLHKGVVSQSIQPLPASLLLNQPKCLQQKLNYQLAFKKTLSLELTCCLYFPRNNIIFPICTGVIKQRKGQHVYNIEFTTYLTDQNRLLNDLATD